MAVRVLRWLEFGFALLALTLLTLACHAMWPDKDGVAAWFQAIGSVAGIAIAIYVPWKQKADEMRERRKDSAQRAVFIARRLKAAADDLVIACVDLNGRLAGHQSGQFRYSTENFRAVTEGAYALEKMDFEHTATELCVVLRSHVSGVMRGMHGVFFKDEPVTSQLVQQSLNWRDAAEAYARAADSILGFCRRQSESF